MEPGEAAVGRFGELLRALRERAGLTQEELAERAGLTSHAVSALERGTRTRPYPHTVRALIGALGASDAERSALLASVPIRRRARAGANDPRPDPAPPPARLVVPPTRLRGREDDLAAVATRLRSGARLVTLTGPGGVGKTRLAAAVADELAPDHPDGVVLVSLAQLNDADLVVPTVARALGLVGSDGPDAWEKVVAHLEPLHVLLVLDNFEHLLSAAAAVGHLVARCPAVSVLASSRSPLRLRGEQEYAVEPLALPDPTTTTLGELVVAPAGALLLDRAAALSLRLDPDPREVRALAGLCHRLAGLPLAIELASAHLRVMTPTSLLERLDDISASSGARDLPERQRTMRATLDWSYGLLSERERTLFRLLGTFRGGATYDAVEKVAAGGGDLPAERVLGLLAQLVEHSLVVVRPGVDSEVRYEQLEPVAQYARSLLVGAEAVRAVAAHAEFFRTLAERAATGYERIDQVAWLARTEADEANLLLAVDRSIDAGDGVTAARITWALWLYWWLRGQVNVGRRRAEQCLAVDLPRSLVARVHLTAATMSYAGGDTGAAAEHWAESARLGALEKDYEVGCKAVAGVGLAELAAGDLCAAESHFREALALGEHAGDAGIWLCTLVHVWLGTVLLVREDPVAAVAEIRSGLDLARERGDRLSTYVGLFNLAQAAVAAGDHAVARHHLEEGIRLSQETQDRSNLAYFLETLAVVEAEQGQARRVAAMLGAARSLREEVGASVYGYYLPDESLRAAAERSARATLGADDYDDAVDTGRAMDVAEVVEFALAVG